MTTSPSWISLLAVPLSLSCSPPYLPTQAYVTRLEGAALRACQVQLRMTVAELLAQCGKPDKIVPWLGHPDTERCLIYETKAAAFGAPAGAPYIAACTGLGEDGQGFLAQDARRRVVAVFGLRDLSETTPSQSP